MNVTLDRYTLGKELGRGASAKVLLGETQDGTQYAVKVFDLTDLSTRKTFLNLLQNELVGEKLDHENVVRYNESSESSTLHEADGQQKQVAYIVQEIATGGDFLGYILSKGPLEEAECKQFFK